MKFKEFDPKLINDDNKVFLIVEDNKKSYCSMYLNDKKELTLAYKEFINDESKLVESTTHGLVQDLRFIKFFDENKNIRLYCQLLYDRFDEKLDCFVLAAFKENNGIEEYIPFEIYHEKLIKYNIKCVPRMNKDLFDKQNELIDSFSLKSM